MCVVPDLLQLILSTMQSAIIKRQSFFDLIKLDFVCVVQVRGQSSEHRSQYSAKGFIMSMLVFNIRYK